MEVLEQLRKKLEELLAARAMAKKLKLNCFTELDFMVRKLEQELKKGNQK